MDFESKYPLFRLHIQNRIIFSSSTPDQTKHPDPARCGSATLQPRNNKLNEEHKDTTLKKKNAKYKGQAEDVPDVYHSKIETALKLNILI